MNNRENLLSVVSAVYRWRKTIRNICIVALAGSILFSLTLNNYYKAVTIFYPASPELANPELIFGYTSQVTEYFGSDRDLDRVAEIANGNEVVDFMIKRFRLYEHYDIDSTTLKGQDKVRKRFRSLYKAIKNKNDAIELSIEDTDARTAAEMANTARDKVNELAQRMIKSSQATLLTTFEDNIRRKLIELKMLGDSLEFLQEKYDIYNIGTQSEQLATQLATAESEIIRTKARLEVLENNPLIRQDTIQYIKANLRAYERERASLRAPQASDGAMTLSKFNEGQPIITIIADLHYQARKQLTYDQERYNQIKSAYNTNIPAIQVVEVAETPFVKSRPRRSILVLAALAAAFFLSVVAILLVDSYRDVNWREVFK